MSKAPAILVLLVAILSGLFASASVMRYINTHQKGGQATSQIKKVLVAKEDIQSGSTIGSEHVALVERAVEIVPPGAFSSLDQIENRLVKSTIYRGEYVMNERLVEPGSPNGLPALIPAGQRAITLKVDDTISVAGFVQPGHHVDIVGTMEVGEDQKETISKVILQNIRVLAIGQEIETKDEQKPKVVPTVTVLVTLEEAEKLALASKVGMVRLVLRNYKDNDFEMTEGVKLSSLVPNVEPMPLPAPELVEESTPPSFHTVILFRGAERSELSFSRP